MSVFEMQIMAARKSIVSVDQLISNETIGSVDQLICNVPKECPPVLSIHMKGLDILQYQNSAYQYSQRCAPKALQPGELG